LRIKEIAKLFSQKYRGKVLLGDVAEVAGEIIRETCKEFDISGQKGYEKADTVGGRGESREGRGELYSYEETSAMPVVIIDEGQGKTLKTGYISLYIKLFKVDDV